MNKQQQSMWSIVGVTCILYLGVIAEVPGDVKVTIAQGVVAGSRATDGEYFEFHGIPYADSTSGPNRFKAPTPPPSFGDVFVANRKDVKCVRALGVGYEGTEDCLVANIFTPSLNRTRLFPVMVWINGKEFKLHDNAPELSYSNFIQEEVVVVSLNYRESVLGFLCLGTETAPGNAGLKDIIAGLKWIRQNIVNFGGNPENISIFGHGSGAAAVDLVSLSPRSEGLIQRVITQSGNALSPWAVTRDNIKHAVHVAEALGHKITNIVQLSEVFTRTNVAALMAVINELDLTDNSLAFAPCIENESLEYGEPFLLKSPFEILLKGEYTSVPIMTGFVDKEGTIKADKVIEKDWLEKMDDTFADFIQSDLIFDNDNEDIVKEIKENYFGNQVIDSSKINEFLSYQGDTMILVSTLRQARMRSLSSSSPIYVYQFSYKGSLGEPFTGPLSVDKTAHSEELAYLFRNPRNTETNQLDLTISDILIERWTNFAKTGVPMSKTSKVIWHPFTHESYSYLKILNNYDINNKEGGSLEQDSEDPYPETMSFWEEIYADHFLDAEGKWDLTDRIEDGDSSESSGEGEGSGDGDGGGEDNGSGDGDDGGEDNGSGDGDGDGEDNGSGDGDGGGDGDDDGNSATTAVGYTFLITSLFAILGNLHMSNLVS